MQEDIKEDIKATWLYLPEKGTIHRRSRKLNRKTLTYMDDVSIGCGWMYQGHKIVQHGDVRVRVATIVWLLTRNEWIHGQHINYLDGNPKNTRIENIALVSDQPRSPSTNERKTKPFVIRSLGGGRVHVSRHATFNEASEALSLLHDPHAEIIESRPYRAQCRVEDVIHELGHYRSREEVNQVKEKFRKLLLTCSPFIAKCEIREQERRQLLREREMYEQERERMHETKQRVLDRIRHPPKPPEPPLPDDIPDWLRA